MNILFLTKRYYMSSDVLEDRSGRCYEIPDQLSRSGHQVHLICHSYRNTEEKSVTYHENLTLTSWNLGINPLYGFIRHYRRVNRLIMASRPDIIIAGSDCYQVIIGSALARRHGIPFIADLYDNFAYFGASKVPGVLTLFARALKYANAVTVVSSTLMKLVEERYAPTGTLHQVENAVTRYFLAHHNRSFSRDYFGFEAGPVYIGTAGELTHEKGIDLLISAFCRIAEVNERIVLVLAGKRDRRLTIPDRDNIRYLGQLPHDEVPLLFSALDIGVVCIQNNNFGRYCFPQKLYEMLACELPLVVADVGEMSSLLEHYPGIRYRPDDSADLQRAILGQLANPQKLEMDVPSWETQAQKFDRIIDEVMSCAGSVKPPQINQARDGVPR